MWLSGHSYSSSYLLSCRFVKWGAIMYTLANLDFSNRFGVVVSELPPDEMDGQDQTLDAKQGATLSDLADLEMAVFDSP